MCPNQPHQKAKPDRSCIMYIDGGARGNPGPAASAWILKDADGNCIAGSGIYLGSATNNAAEYEALLNGLKDALKHDVRILTVYSDSELLVKQMRGEYKIKNPQLRILREKIGVLIARLQKVTLYHIPREQNKDADTLVNVILDKQQLSK